MNLASGVQKYPDTGWRTATSGPHKGLKYKVVKKGGDVFHQYAHGAMVRIPKTFDSQDPNAKKSSKSFDTTG